MSVLVFLGLSVLELGPMYATDRQTDVRQKHRSMSPPIRGGGIIIKYAALNQLREFSYLIFVLN